MRRMTDDLTTIADDLIDWRQLHTLLDDNFTAVHLVPTNVCGDALLRITMDMPSGFLTQRQQNLLRDTFLEWLTISLEDKECMALIAQHHEEEIITGLFTSVLDLITGKETKTDA
jgi:hypothetical protein